MSDHTLADSLEEIFLLNPVKALQWETLINQRTPAQAMIAIGKQMGGKRPSVFTDISFIDKIMEPLPHNGKIPRGAIALVLSDAGNHLIYDIEIDEFYAGSLNAYLITKGFKNVREGRRVLRLTRPIPGILKRGE